MRFAFLVVLSVCFAWGPASRADQSDDVEHTRTIGILSGRHPLQLSAANFAQRKLEEDGFECQVIALPDAGDSEELERQLESLSERGPKVLAAGGREATDLLVSRFPETPVVHFMASRALHTELLSSGDSDQARVAGVATEASTDDQLQWVQLLDPECKRIGVLYSESSAETVRSFSEAAQHARIEIAPILADRSRFADALDALEKCHCDAVLMLADAQIYNSPNVQELILWGLRRKVGIFAFSGNVVKAGALGGCYTTPEAVGACTADIVTRIAGGADPSDIGLEFAKPTEKAVNLTTLRRLGLRVSDSAIEKAEQYGE